VEELDGELDWSGLGGKKARVETEISSPWRDKGAPKGAKWDLKGLPRFR